MSAFQQFTNSIAGAEHLIAMYIELRRTRGLGARGALSAENSDLLWLPRASVVASLSALDAYMHSMLHDRIPHALRMDPIPEPLCEAMASLLTIKNAKSFRDSLPIIKNQDSLSEMAKQFKERTLNFLSYQAPEKIIAGFDLIGKAGVFDSIAATWPGPRTSPAEIKQNLSHYVKRRNQIAHEGDMELSGVPRPMQPAYAHGCREFIINLTYRLNRVAYGI